MATTFVRSSYHRRGVSIVAAVVSMPILIGAMALVIDLGTIYAAKSEVRNIADAGALAGAGALRDNQWETAADQSLAFIESNQLAQGFTSLADQVVEVGRWDSAAKTFTASAASSANAIRVATVRADVPLRFAPFLGISTSSVNGEAIAMITPSCGGVWGMESVTVPGNVLIDSYDSTQGPYSAGAAGDNGDLCSNVDITVSGNATINGDVMSDSVTINGGSVSITGITEQATVDADVPVLDFTEVAATNDNGSIGLTDNGQVAFDPVTRDLHIQAGDNLTLAAGTYYFNIVTFDAPGTLSLAGPVKLYTTGDLNASGSGTINTSLDPHDLAIVSSAALIQITGSVQFYGSILAPNAEVRLAGNADFFGAVIAREVNISGNFGFHVDDSVEIMRTLRSPPTLVQ